MKAPVHQKLWWFLHIVIVLGAASPVYAERGRSKLKDFTWLIHFTASWSYASSAADNVTNAVYSQKFSNPIVGNAGFGREIWRGFFMGFRYEYWLATCKYTLAGTETRDKLNQQAIGLDFGFKRATPRVYWLLVASAFYPVAQSVISEGASSITYDRSPRAYYYEARLNAGIKLNSFLSLLLEGGYRMMNFGDLTSGTRSYLSGQNFDLSGPFGGAGIGLHF